MSGKVLPYFEYLFGVRVGGTVRQSPYSRNQEGLSSLRNLPPGLPDRTAYSPRGRRAQLTTFCSLFELQGNLPSVELECLNNMRAL